MIVKVRTFRYYFIDGSEILNLPCLKYTFLLDISEQTLYKVQKF